MGKDLKEEHQSWDKAFNLHPFMLRQLQLIKNFNLRYECLDACDNFHAQLRKGDQFLIHSWDSDGNIDLSQINWTNNMQHLSSQSQKNLK